MLDINTLKQLSDLSANTLYTAEVARLPKLLQEDEVALIERARQGDSEAREALIVSCLSYALYKSRSIYHERQPRHDDLLDLVQEASIRMIINIDTALAKTNPASYLRGIARTGISRCCTYSGLVQKPQLTLKELEKLEPVIVESLDKLLNDDNVPEVELIQSPAILQGQDESDRQKRHTMLHRAVRKLPRRQQEIIVRLYGLFGQPKECIDEIGLPSSIRSNSTSARKNLRVFLSEHQQQMLSDMPEKEEE